MHVYFDADADAVTDARRKLVARGITGHVLPYALGAQDGTGTLHINYDPYTSSLYPSCVREDEHVRFVGFDAIGAVQGRTMQQRELRVHRLDGLAELLTGAIPAPDVISLDTQGSELDILRGAGATLAGTLAVVSEVEFLESYTGQPLFGELSSFLNAAGFLFIGFDATYDAQPYRVPIGLRGKGYTSFGEAFFLRAISTVAADADKLAKLALVAHLKGQHAYGFRCMEVYAQRFSPFVATERSNPCLGFLAELAAALEHQPVVMPWTFEDLYSWQDSRARFSAATAAYAERSIAARKEDYARHLLAQRAAIERLAAQAWTPIEEVLLAHGMEGSAHGLRAARIDNILELLRYAGIPFSNGPAR